MDTSSHVLLGFTMAGLAMLDPAIAGNAAAEHAVLAASLIGNNAPDFDAVVRLRGKAAYLRHHRGITHSLPAQPVWALAIGLPCALLYGAGGAAVHIVLWTLAAVFFHILLDLLNAYGVQCMRPFSKRWWHADALCLFDPYLFVSHAAALIAWSMGHLPPGPLFGILYAATAVYLAWRVAEHRRILRLIRRRKRWLRRVKLSVIPGMSGAVWQFVAETDETYITGRVLRSRIVEEARIARHAGEPVHPAVAAAKGTDGVRAFLGFAERVHIEWREQPEGYEVTWSDVRFWYNHHMPFRAAVTLDRNLNVVQDRIGWYKKTWEPPFV